MKAVATALGQSFMLTSCSISSSCGPVVEGMGTLYWGRGAILGSRETRRTVQRKGETTGFEDRPEASAEISSVLGVKVRRPFLFHPLLEHPGLGLKLRSSAPSSLARLGSPSRFWGPASPDRSIPEIHAERWAVYWLISAARLFISPLTTALPHPSSFTVEEKSRDFLTVLFSASSIETRTGFIYYSR
jgi:hypothetical protein